MCQTVGIVAHCS